MVNTLHCFTCLSLLHPHLKGGDRVCNAALKAEAWHHRTRMVGEKVFNTCSLDLTVSILLHETAARHDPHRHVTVEGLRHSVNKARSSTGVDESAIKIGLVQQGQSRRTHCRLSSYRPGKVDECKFVWLRHQKRVFVFIYSRDHAFHFSFMTQPPSHL